MSILKERRLLLLEFVTRDRWVFNSRFFPFINGFAETSGIDSMWLYYGAEMQTDKGADNEVVQFIELPPDDIQHLKRCVERLKPTHILISHPVSEEIARALKGAGEAPSILTMSSIHGAAGIKSIYDYIHEVPARYQPPDSGRPDSGSYKYERAKVFSNWFLYWIGENRRSTLHYDQYIAGTFKPSYCAIPGNAAAAGYKPPVVVFGGISCDHLGKVGDNPLYKGINLEGCTQDYGCSFCTMFRGQVSDMTADPVASAEEQFKRGVETSGPNGRFSGVFNIYDIRLFKQIDRFFEMIFRIGLPPAVFCFEPRIELFLETAGMIASLLPAIEKAGHVLSISGMGAENLVYEENLLFNKNVEIGQIDRALEYLKEFSERFPRSFKCSLSLSYITCSPWTTLEMLETGITRGIERNFDPFGDWLYSPLLLFHGAPITRLAENEGGIILQRHEELSLLYKPVVNEIDIGSFVPWRFKDGRTGAAFSLIVRFCAAALRSRHPDAIFDGDGLYSRILDFESSGGSLERPDLFAAKVIAAVKESAPHFDKEKILGLALEGYRASFTPAGRENSRKKRVPTPLEMESRRQKIKYLMKALLEKPYFKDVALTDLKESYENSAIQLEIAVGNSNYRLFLLDPSGIDNYLFRTEHFAVCSAKETPIVSENTRKKIVSLINLFDRALAKYAPEILP